MGAALPACEVGDIVTLKKKHPCGSSEWKVLRVGADFRLQCMGCGRLIMVPRSTVTKSVRGIRKETRVTIQGLTSIESKNKAETDSQSD